MNGSEKQELWLHQIANAILAAEKPAAMTRIKESSEFRREAQKAVKLHQQIFTQLDNFHFRHEGRADPVAVVGGWSGREGGSASVVEMPSLRRRPEVERPFAALGKLLADGLCGLLLTVGPGYGARSLVWCNDDNQEWDISTEDDLLALLLDIKTECATDERFQEVSKHLRAGEIPPPS